MTAALPDERKVAMGFDQMRDQRKQIASTVKPGTPFRAAVIRAREITFLQTAYAGEMAMLNALLAQLGPLNSRGHGGRTPHHASKRYVAMDKRGVPVQRKGNPANSRYYPHQGQRECERRVRQLKQGFIQP